MQEVQSKLRGAVFSIKAGGAGFFCFERLDSVKGTARGLTVFIKCSGWSRGQEFAGYSVEEFARFEAESVRQDGDVGGEVFYEEVIEDIFERFYVCHGALSFRVKRFRGSR